MFIALCHFRESRKRVAYKQRWSVSHAYSQCRRYIFSFLMLWVDTREPTGPYNSRSFSKNGSSVPGSAVNEACSSAHRASWSVYSRRTKYNEYAMCVEMKYSVPLQEPQLHCEDRWNAQWALLPESCQRAQARPRHQRSLIRWLLHKFLQWACTCQWQHTHQPVHWELPTAVEGCGDT